MNGEVIPDSTAPLLSEIVGEGLPTVNVEIIHHHVNRSRREIAAGNAV
jgi:hypothetical protein